MLDDDAAIEFGSEEDLRKPVPAGTVALVQVRPQKDAELGDFKTGESQYGPWMIVNFEVVEGEHNGEWAGTIINVKPSDRKFRAIFEAVTGIDISSGGSVSFADFKEKLITGVFEAELGPEVRKGQPTGYTAVTKVLRRVRERDAAAVQEVASVEASDDGNDEDIPF
jgi:hypothetical protein